MKKGGMMKVENLSEKLFSATLVVAAVALMALLSPEVNKKLNAIADSSPGAAHSAYLYQVTMDLEDALVLSYALKGEDIPASGTLTGGEVNAAKEENAVPEDWRFSYQSTGTRERLTTVDVDTAGTDVSKRCQTLSYHLERAAERNPDAFTLSACDSDGYTLSRKS